MSEFYESPGYTLSESPKIFPEEIPVGQCWTPFGLSYIPDIEPVYTTKERTRNILGKDK